MADFERVEKGVIDTSIKPDLDISSLDELIRQEGSFEPLMAFSNESGEHTNIQSEHEGEMWTMFGHAHEVYLYRNQSGSNLLIAESHSEENPRLGFIYWPSKDEEISASRYLTSSLSVPIKRDAVLFEKNPNILDTIIYFNVDRYYDVRSRSLYIEGEEVHLRPKETKILLVLALNNGIPVSHRNILRNVWGPEYREEKHYVRLYVNYLRKKVEPDNSDPEFILSERGIGYKLKAEIRGSNSAIKRSLQELQ